MNKLFLLSTVSLLFAQSLPLSMREGCGFCNDVTVVTDFPTPVIGFNTGIEMRYAGNGGITGYVLLKCNKSEPANTLIAWNAAIAAGDLRVIKNCFVKGSLTPNVEKVTPGACLQEILSNLGYALKLEITGDNKERDIEALMGFLQKQPNSYKIAIMTCDDVDNQFISAFRKVNLIISNQIGETRSDSRSWITEANYYETIHIDDTLLTFNINSLTGIN